MDFPQDAVFYVRFSLMKPKRGQKERVIELHRQLVEWLPGQPGFVRGYLILSGDPYGRVGHLNVYRSEEDAERVAQTQHILSLRSELNLIIEPESHAEHSYEAFDPQLAQQVS